METSEVNKKMTRQGVYSFVIFALLSIAIAKPPPGPSPWSSFASKPGKLIDKKENIIIKYYIYCIGFSLCQSIGSTKWNWFNNCSLQAKSIAFLSKIC